MEDRYIKCPVSGALINTDYSAYNQIISERAQRKKELEKDIEMDKLRIEMTELRQMLQGMTGINV
jgi:DNA-directed RNA polymerase subunit N (RpoN/RPB10)